MITTTLRNYLSISELETLGGLEVLDDTEALRQIARAEAAVDNYVGNQLLAIDGSYTGKITAVDGKTIFDTEGSSHLTLNDGYFAGGVIEIVSGTGKGQARAIESSNKDARSITTVDDWDTAPDTTSYFKIYQLGSFPRYEDAYTSADGLFHFRSVPDAIKQAVVAQIEYSIAQGEGFMNGDDSSFTSEKIGNYSYSKGDGSGSYAGVTLTSPRARNLLRGFKRSIGELQADNPTCL